MPVDLSSLPLDDLKKVYAVLTRKEPLSVHLIPSITKLIDWTYSAFLKDRTLSPVGAGVSDVSEEDAIEALINGAIIDDEADTSAIGGPFGGILASVAVSLLSKALAKLVKDLLDS